MTITQYEDGKHRTQTIALWEDVFGYEAKHNVPGLVIDKKIAVDDLFFVALKDDFVVGTIMAGYDGHRGWIYSLAVHPNERGLGIGSRLLSFAEDQLAKRGCIKVNLQIMAGNRAVQAFYEGNGFAAEERISMGKQLG